MTGFAVRRAGVIALLALIVTALAGTYVSRNIAITTDNAALLPEDIGWRQENRRLKAAFPILENAILVVVDGSTPERAEQAAATLQEKLAAEPNRFESVRRPDGGPFFARNGLLFLPEGDVAEAMQSLVDAQPLLAVLAADPSLRGLGKALDLAAAGLERGDTAPEEIAPLIAKFDASMKSALAGAEEPIVYLDWQSLISDTPTEPRNLRRFLLVQPKLDYTRLAPGRTATDRIRAIVEEEGLNADQGVTVRLSGAIPLSDEEFASVAENMGITVPIMILLVAMLLWFALRSITLIVSILLTLISGLALTASFGLMVIGPLNLISVAFAVLFVGMGVDFGIQVGVRYRSERAREQGRLAALKQAGAGVGGSLLLAAVCTAAGFYAFLPTDYRGVSELGAIAGTGMLIAVTLSLTLLPALIRLFRSNASAAEPGFPALKRVESWYGRRSGIPLVASGVLACAGLALLPLVSFDFNPLNLKSQKTESVSTLFDLMADGQGAPNTIEILEPNLDTAAAVAAKLKALPEVERALTLNSFVPRDQEAKLLLIEDTSFLLETTLYPFDTPPAPTDAETVSALKATSSELAGVANGTPELASLAATLEKLADAPEQVRERARQATIPGLETLLKQIRLSLQAAPVSLDSLPEDLRTDWVAPDGQARIEVSPSGDANDNANLRKFAEAVLKIAPNATGPAVAIQESGDIIVGAFVQAGIWALLSIALVLALVLRRVRDVALTLAPLLLAGLLTMASTVVLHLPLNFANIIALPLLFGMGVAFNVYYVMAWRHGERSLLSAPLTRAILFSALTTATAFGSLWMSSHPGTSSMGALLMLSLFWTLLSSFGFLLPLLARVSARSG